MSESLVDISMAVIKRKFIALDIYINYNKRIKINEIYNSELEASTKKEDKNKSRN